MRIGCCTNMLAREGDSVGQWAIEDIAEFGYEYLDLPVAQMMELDDGEFEKLKQRIQASGLECEACNNLFPASVKITGPSVDLSAVRNYLDTAIRRVEELGAELICFGSSGARNIPAGFPVSAAWEQMVSICRIIDEYVSPRNITIVIEPLNRGESNIVNSAAEGYELSRAADRKSIQLLVDYYHLALENESVDIILKADKSVRHCHISNPDGRSFPSGKDGAVYDDFFRALGKIGYTGRLSAEAFTSDFTRDGREALRFLKERTSIIEAGGA
ncbi:sugar phosphate isomerase/epimerase family protein [Marispirochaeta aestuarii]|uniref:sugar phosphate isomerase/epimerase family protein n=1 Tax=Marispirochaeta aestuarii TaxID=1963862 RepID=UPI0029C747DC|nr:sugar phosphate isomerase/epimerase family protein [Marispirochaeta aestuarii]